MKKVQLRISDIKLLTVFQIRGINEDHVASLMETHKDMEPVVVYDITDRDYNMPVLVAGRHRRQARVNLGQDHIFAERKIGTYAQALLESITSNTGHGLPLTMEEKKSACRLLLKQFPERANNFIASDVGLSDHTVKNIRTSMETRKDIPIITNKIGIDDKERGPRASSNTSGQVNLHLSFNMASEDQLKIVNDALVQAGVEGQTKKANRALELVCAEYMAGNRMKIDNGNYDASKFVVKMSNHDEV